MNNEETKVITDRLSAYISKAINFRKTNKDTEYLNHMAYYEGLHWKLADLSDEKPFLVKSDINHVKNALDLRLASLFASDYIGDISPLSSDDIDSIDKLKLAYESEWKRLKLDELIKRAIKNSAILGESYVLFNYDTDKIHGGTNAKIEGTPTVTFIPTSNVYVDPSATSFYDADYYIIRHRKTKQWIKRNKPEWYKKLKEHNSADGSNTINSDAGEIYVGHDYSSEQDNIFFLDQIYEKVLGEREIPVFETSVDEMGNEIKTVVGTEMIKSQKVEIHYMINNILLETNDKYPFPECPLIQMAWEEMEDSPYCIPLMRGLTTPQKVVNLIESAVNNLALHFTFPTWLVSDESGLDAEEVAKLTGAAGVVYEVSGDPAKAITAVRPPAIDNQLLLIKDSFIANIREYAGVNNAYQGMIGTAGNTKAGAETAVARATMVDTLPLTQIEKFVERISKMLIRYICHYYKNKEYFVKNKDQQSGRYTFDSFTIDELWEFLEYDYNIDLSIKTQNDKNRQFQMLQSLYQMQLQYKDPIKLINVLDLVKTAELDNYNELFVRYKDMSEADMQNKVSMIMELMEIANTPKPDGTPLIDSALLQDALVDVLNDDGDLQFAEQIMNEYEQYSEQLKMVEGELNAPQV